MDRYFRNRTAFSIFVIPALIVFTFTVFVPIAWSIGYSMFKWNGITQMRFIGLDNYRTMLLEDKTLWMTFRNNLVYVGVNVVMQVGLGMLVALLLNQINVFRNLFKTLYFTPAIISSVAICQVFSKALSIEPMGIVNALFHGMGLEHMVRAWLSDKNWALVIVSFVEGYRYIGLYMVILYSALISLPGDVIEAARIDGANPVQMFLKIKFPLIRGVFGVAVIMVVNGTMKGFDVPYILTNGGPGKLSELVATYMYKTAFLSSKFGYGSAVAVFIAIECLVMVLLLKRIYLADDEQSSMH